MKGSVNTSELQALNILCPNPRLFELRKLGFHIVTTRVWVTDNEGHGHKIGLYTYLSKENRLTKRGQEFLKGLNVKQK